MKAMSITLAACLMICVSTLINSLCSSKIGCMCVEFLVECLVTDVTFFARALYLYQLLNCCSFCSVGLFFGLFIFFLVGVDSGFDGLVIRNCFRYIGFRVWGVICLSSYFCYWICVV
ncbi:hypothetical protein HanPSC8_Chr11g0484011 [Helianthus annuus]|nr:hypothetical protein HanPSC8_Chr11g0484011 [Helianthus annuus]